MLKTVEAIMEPSGQVLLKEPVKVKSPRRALVTVLDEETGNQKEEGGASQTEPQREERLKLSGVFDSGLTDISQNVDKYLYE